MKNNNKFILQNGVSIPSIGFGTDRTFIYIRKNVLYGTALFLKDLITNDGYLWKRDKSIYSILKRAPQNGCWLFDTASAYGQSERIIGHALSSYKREEIFLITKLSNLEQREGNVEKALRKSIKHMRVDAVDLYLMHWPQTDTYIDSWRQMENLYRKGLARAIGVCNFKKHHFEELAKYAQIQPMVCQIESHPLFTQDDMLEYCTEKGIQMMAYTPTARMNAKLKQNNILNNIAQKYEKSIAQIIVRWHHQRNVIPIINTTKIEHLQENMDVFNFSLTKSEMKKISNININCRLRYDPDKVDFTKC